MPYSSESDNFTESSHGVHLKGAGVKKKVHQVSSGKKKREDNKKHVQNDILLKEAEDILKPKKGKKLETKSKAAVSTANNDEPVTTTPRRLRTQRKK